MANGLELDGRSAWTFGKYHVTIIRIENLRDASVQGLTYEWAVEFDGFKVKKWRKIGH